MPTEVVSGWVTECFPAWLSAGSLPPPHLTCQPLIQGPWVVRDLIPGGMQQQNWWCRSQLFMTVEHLVAVVSGP
jgi:hypothetical protein